MLDDEIDGVEHDAVIIDQRQGALAMMRHLVDECGAQRVIFVGGPKTNIDTQARYKAYRDTLRKAGLKFHKDDVYHLDYTYDSAYRLAMEHAATGRGRIISCLPPTTRWRPASSPGRSPRSVSVPHDLGVVGFDDTRVAQMTNPLLTTVRVPMSRMGANAIELLCQRIAEPARPPARVSLAAELVVRDSCGCGPKRLTTRMDQVR